MPADDTTPVFVPTLAPPNANAPFAMPAVGYGTMLFPEPERAVGLVVHAIESGYRHIDTARKFGSEQWVGEGIRASGLAREELFVTTKVTEEGARADDFALSDEEMDRIGALRDRNLRIVDPEVRRPVWDEG